MNENFTVVFCIVYSCLLTGEFSIWHMQDMFISQFISIISEMVPNFFRFVWNATQWWEHVFTDKDKYNKYFK